MVGQAHQGQVAIASAVRCGDNTTLKLAGFTYGTGSLQRKRKSATGDRPSPFLFGRSVHADHVESQPEINRRHALFCYYLKGWMLHDLASSNGCKRDGLRITDADLQVGDELQLGKLVYIVEAVDPPALDESIDSESVAIEALETETLTEMEACRLAFFKDGQRIGAVLVVARALIGNADRVEIQLPKRGLTTFMHSFIA